MMKKEIKLFYTKDWHAYEILDTGEGEKLERVGLYTFIRPQEDAVWRKDESIDAWKKNDGKFWSSKEGAKSGWKLSNKTEKKWDISYKDIKFIVTPTPFRHYGFFPEQAAHWDFIENKINEVTSNKGGQVKFLNLFGYTGVASLFALRAGADVTHVDASKTSVASAKENQELSGMGGLPMRLIVDDVLKFLDREIKRGNKYDAVIMDPPKFGRGPKGETWKLEKDLPKLLEKVTKVLSPDPLFVILTSYATDSSSLSLGLALEESLKNLGGQVDQGELCVLEKSHDRLISLAHTTVWTK
ncbi:MAG: class I SAM-dependent methyltransferase [Patescibacteria group bacterium]